jgi:hypothetical protein
MPDVIDAGLVVIAQPTTAPAVDWHGVMTTVIATAIIAGFGIAWKINGSKWAQRLADRNDPTPCPRCAREVPRWFIDKVTPLPPIPAPPAISLGDRAQQLMVASQGALSIADAQVAAKRERDNLPKKAPEAPRAAEFGCLVCGGVADSYPRSSESRKAFTRRSRN